ncbi:MAG TPA: chemotaxis-specific protein-glutamate methyltransferase CheB [Geminicoccus sp.]|uniref:chemotaxis-specific protein-glutamate methyltransferase CheB n=1 Tax=Geminicoccus sp. TaxID=2024832 RepID=UPI002E3497E9|nr:chemotaxis-specific protein-glutamate methyltransferase CheB [Geminicoccus sp.]HEX2525439.1 chemotaxis-specific protein-glutamate methyltransferase CheB [Geminicoccus sp.]
MTRLLIVDDSALMRRLLGDLFAAAGGFEIAYARNGVEALGELNVFKPDVITLDVHMPEMDGLSCLDRIMVERPCPVVMVSAMTEAGAEVTLEAIGLGAVDFIPKPGGAISLKMDVLGPQLIEKVRAAAQARLPKAHRLAERLRLRRGELGMRSAPGRPARLAPAGAPPPAEPPPLAGPFEGAVVVGTSTGGPPALDALLAPLPANFPRPILVAQHMPASFTGPLARRLDRLCALTVLEVSRPIPLAPGHVYIGRGEADLIVGLRPAGLTAVPAPAKPEHRWHPSADRLVTSAIEQIGAQRLIGILMTGMGNDGAAGMTELRRAGGRTIAEAEETAVVWGMPGELVRAGGAEFIVPLQEIAARLLDLVPVR